MTAKADMLE